MVHGAAREGKWKGNWRMQCVASTLHTTSEHGVSSITTADAHTLAASSRLNLRPPADLNGLVRFAERWNLLSARVPSHFNWPLPGKMTLCEEILATSPDAYRIGIQSNVVWGGGGADLVQQNNDLVFSDNTFVNRFQKTCQFINAYII